MWGAALLLLGGALVGLDGALGGAAGEDDSPYNEYYDRDPALNYEEEEEGDFYGIYDETDTIATLLTDPVTVAVSRKRRYEEPANAIEPHRMQYIQDVLKQVMAGRDIEDELDGLADNEDGFPFRPSRTSEMRPAVRYSPTATKTITNTTMADDVETVTEPSNTYTTTESSNTDNTTAIPQSNATRTTTTKRTSASTRRRYTNLYLRSDAAGPTTPNATLSHKQLEEIRKRTKNFTEPKLNLTSRELAQLQYANLTQREYKILQKKTDNKFTTLAPKISAKVLADIRNRTKNFTDLLAIITPDELDALQHAKLTEEEYELLQKRTNGAFTTADPGPPETSATTVKVTEKSSRRTTSRRGQISKGNETFPPGVKYDINAIIAIIANLTYDYEWNLTEEFNRTLIEHGVPTCPTASTLSTTPTTPAAYDFSNTSIVGKCFVCGLRTPEIPRSAACADAFSGDFLPLAPIDARARGQIATFRKYCRHLDVHNYVENPSEPRSIYGRFTGGCGVRWTDLTGVYTQRTCRARFRPMMGLHFASKRMAKLELALINVENGCIVSPMASLLAMSRGVSLYARFHACVCSGNWCNRARRPLPLSTLPPALALLALRAWIR